MPRLIDADALIGELHTQFFYDGRDRTRIYAKIQDQPTIEPERKKGRWVRITKDTAKCSVCEDYIDNAISCGYNYCPNCGCEMER